MGQKPRAVRQVSCIGIGGMGSALANAFLTAGHEVTVWNRSGEKCRPLAEAGARVAGSAAEACAKSDTVVACLANHAATMEVLDSPEAAAGLSGRTLVQFCSRLPEEARREQEWATGHGIAYLSAAILCYPESIGSPSSLVIFSGSRIAFDSQRSLLLSLGEEIPLVGENPETVCVLDVGCLSFYYGLHMAFFTGAALCDAQGVTVEQYLSVIRPYLTVMRGSLESCADMIMKQQYVGAQASLDVHVAAFEPVTQLSRTHGMDSRYVDCVLSYLREASAAGKGDEQLAWAFEQLRSRDALA